MGVRIDKARRDDAAIGVDDFACTVLDLADFGDAAVLDGNVSLIP